MCVCVCVRACVRACVCIIPLSILALKLPQWNTRPFPIPPEKTIKSEKADDKILITFALIFLSSLFYTCTSHNIDQQKTRTERDYNEMTIKLRWRIKSYMRQHKGKSRIKYVPSWDMLTMATTVIKLSKHRYRFQIENGTAISVKCNEKQTFHITE